MLTPEQLQEIRERCARATKGPWYVHNLDDGLDMNVYLIATTPDEPDPWSGDPEKESRKIIAITLLQSPIRVACVEDGKWEENATFIAGARTDVPDLLDHIDALTDALTAALVACESLLRCEEERVRRTQTADPSWTPEQGGGVEPDYALYAEAVRLARAAVAKARGEGGSDHGASA